VFAGRTVTKVAVATDISAEAAIITSVATPLISAATAPAAEPLVEFPEARNATVIWFSRR